jgi:hypothetical protein
VTAKKRRVKRKGQGKHRESPRRTEEAMKWTGNIIEPDGCLRKEDRKREEKLKAERMAEQRRWRMRFSRRF